MEETRVGAGDAPEIIEVEGATPQQIAFQKFAEEVRRRLRDLNNNERIEPLSRYSRADIQRWLVNPEKFEKELRSAIIYIYGASPHFRRLVQYFVGLTDISYIIEPYQIDPKTASAPRTNTNYRKVLKLLSSMNLQTTVPDILTVCFREDVFYGTMWLSGDSIMIQQLPSDYCKVSSIENNVFNVAFNFTYFNTRLAMLDSFPEEFRVKYEAFRARNGRGKWVELDSPTSWAVKCNRDIPNYPLPPFIGILREIYDIEDYKQLRMVKTELENYAMVAMKLPMTDTGEWGIDLTKAMDFWSNLDATLPSEIGSILTPMDLDKISFERTHTGDTETVAEAEQNLYTAAGVQSLLFNNTKSSANALLLSIKVDQALTYAVVKSIGDVINRFIQSMSFGRHFRINFLDVSPFNRKEAGDAYLKAASYGFPTISMYAASQGLGQEELDSMNFLEDKVLGLPQQFKPLRSSSQMSSEEIETKSATDEGGAPEKDIGEISDSGEQSAEDRDDWG